MNSISGSTDIKFRFVTKIGAKTGAFEGFPSSEKDQSG